MFSLHLHKRQTKLAAAVRTGVYIEYSKAIELNGQILVDRVTVDKVDLSRHYKMTWDLCDSDNRVPGLKLVDNENVF